MRKKRLRKSHINKEKSHTLSLVIVFLSVFTLSTMILSSYPIETVGRSIETGISTVPVAITLEELLITTSNWIDSIITVAEEFAAIELWASWYTSWTDRIRLTRNDFQSRNPDIAIDTNNKFHIVWADARGGFGTDIYYTQLGTNGDYLLDGHIPLSSDLSSRLTEDVVLRLTTDLAISEDPTIAIANNKIHIVWVDDRNGKRELYYKWLYYSSGALEDYNDLQLTGAPGDRSNPDIAIDAADNNVIHLVWHDYRNGNWEIYYRKIRHAGVVYLGNDIRLTNDLVESSFPSLAVDSNQKIHIVWQDTRTGHYEIYYKYIYWNGDALEQSEEEIQLSAMDSSDSENPSISIDQDDNIHVVWEDWKYGLSNSEIYYRKINSDSTLENEKRITNAFAHSERPSIVAQTQLPYNLHITWLDDRNDARTDEVFYKLLTNNGDAILQDTQLTAGSSQQPIIAVDYRDPLRSHIVFKQGDELYYKQGSSLPPVVTSCSSDGDCAADQFCEFTSCSGTTGTCTYAPDVCPAIDEPVCACDGTFYDNVCERLRARSLEDHSDSCSEIPCELSCQSLPVAFASYIYTMEEFNGNLYLAAGDRLYKSTDGSTFQQVYQYPGKQITNLIVFNNLLYAVIGSNLYASSNGELFQITNDLAGLVIGGLGIYNNKLYVGSTIHLYSSDNGINFQEIFTLSPPQNIRSIEEFQNNLYVGVLGSTLGSYSEVYKSTNGISFVRTYLMDGSPLMMESVNNQLYVGDMEGRIHLTLDGTRFAHVQILIDTLSTYFEVYGDQTNEYLYAGTQYYGKIYGVCRPELAEFVEVFDTAASQITALQNFNGYLYAAGDQEIYRCTLAP